MNKKITFHNMQHSQPLEDHTNEKLEKIINLLEEETQKPPFSIEIWLKANSLHPHHAAELHVKTKNLNLNAHDEGTDMYVVIDNTIDKMVKLIKKDKEKTRDQRRNTGSDKQNFNR